MPSSYQHQFRRTEPSTPEAPDPSRFGDDPEIVEAKPLKKFRVKFEAIAWVTAHDADQASVILENSSGALLDNMTVDEIVAANGDETDDVVSDHDAQLHREMEPDCDECAIEDDDDDDEDGE